MRRSPTKRSPWELARERRSREWARAWDFAFIKAAEASKYDPRAFDALRDKQMRLAGDPWELLQILRGHANRCLVLAQVRQRPLREITRLFEAWRRLGFSSDLEEFLVVGLDARTLKDHGQRAAARRWMVQLSDRLAERHGILKSLRKTHASDMRRYK